MKLQEIQSELKVAKAQFNKFGGYKYRSCEDILESLKPILGKNKCAIVLNDDLVLIGTRYYVKATATIYGSDNEVIGVSTAFAREAEMKKGMDESQITGTASSYARKYALNGLLAIDDSKDADTDEFSKKTQPEKNEQKDEIDWETTISEKTNQAITTEVCSRCGAPLAISKEGKKYCSAKCWLVNQSPAPAPTKIIKSDENIPF
jgi:hypothetical protein